MRFGFCVLTGLWLLSSGLMAKDYDLPTKNEQKKALSKIEKVLGRKLKAKSITDNLQLAQSLYEHGENTPDDPVLKYTMLRQAFLYAVAADDFELARSAWAHCRLHYHFPPKDDYELLGEAERFRPKENTTTESFMKAYYSVGLRCFKANDFLFAQRCLKAAQRFARKLKDRVQDRQLKAFMKEVKETERLHQAYHESLNLLEQGEGGPKDHELVGLMLMTSYVSTDKKRFEQGFKHLLKAGSEVAKTTQQELAFFSKKKLQTPENVSKLIEAWENVGRDLGDKALNTLVLVHAYDFCQRALPLMAAFNKPGIEKKMEQLSSQDSIYWELTSEYQKAVPEVSSSGRSKVSQEALVLHLPFTGSADDLSGRANGADLKGGAQWTADRYGEDHGACAFDGQDDYLEVSKAGDFNRFQPMTVSAWIYPQKNDRGGIIGQWGPGKQAGDVFMLSLQDGDLLVTLTRPGKHTFKMTGDETIPLNAWSHIAFVYKKNIATLIINAGKARSSGIIVPQGSEFSQTLKIGVDNRGGKKAHYFKGAIDDVRVYHRALSHDEIKVIFEEQL